MGDAARDTLEQPLALLLWDGEPVGRPEGDALAPTEGECVADVLLLALLDAPTENVALRDSVAVGTPLPLGLGESDALAL